MKGVSGGPVLYFADQLYIVGVISSYRFTSDPLPGLSVAQDLSRIHAIIERYESLDEAERSGEKPGQEQEESKAVTSPS